MAIIPQSIKNLKHFMTARFFHLLYGRPSSKLKIIGVTGTDGKTPDNGTVAAKIRFLIKYFPRPEKPDQHDCHSDKQITD